MKQSNGNHGQICPALSVIVFGLGDGDKPQAGRFPEKLSYLALKAAEQLKLNILKVTTDEIARFAAQLPVGRINSNGSGLIPNVPPKIYQKLTELARGQASPKNLPASWNDIDVGHQVIAFENTVEGWWEAVVTEKKDDMLTLRWRDYPKQPTVVRHRSAVALLNPNIT